jgi:hypothetical protein
MARWLLWLMLTGCPGEAEVATPPEAPQQGQAEADAIATAVAAWRANPGEDLLPAVQQACERGLAVENPSPALDVTLGDALANVMLRPDLGVPRLEKHVATLDAPGRERWLDAVLRSGDLKRFAAEHERWMGAAIDVDHSTAIAYASQAAQDGTVSWRGLPDAVAQARLIEESLALSRRTFDRPTTSIGAMYEALSIILEGWTIEAAAARTDFPDDPDPMLVKGQFQAADGRRRMIAFARSTVPAEVKVPGQSVDENRPPRVVTLAAACTSPGGGGRIFLGAEMDFRNGGPWIFKTNDPIRQEYWIQAGEALLELRKKGKTEAEIAAELHERFDDEIRLGEKLSPAP